MTDEDERAAELRGIAGRVMSALTEGGIADVVYDDEDAVVKAYDEVTEHEIVIVVALA